MAGQRPSHVLDAHRTRVSFSTARRAPLLAAPAPQSPADARPGTRPCEGGGNSLQFERPIAKEEHPSLGKVTKTPDKSAGACLIAAD